MKKWIKELWQNIIDLKSESELATILKTGELFKEMQDSLEANQIIIDNLNTEKYELKYEIFELNKEISDLKISDNDKLLAIDYKKYPKQSNYTFSGKRVRNWVTKNNTEVQPVSGKDNDTIVNNALRYVMNKFTYISDKEGDQWLYADDSWIKGYGDCEDGAFLLYAMCVKSGVDHRRLRVNCGPVTNPRNTRDTVGHAYLTYKRESDNKWYIIDWCYYPRKSLNYGYTWSEAKEYFTCWFSFNSDAVWVDTNIYGGKK